MDNFGFFNLDLAQACRPVRRSYLDQGSGYQSPGLSYFYARIMFACASLWSVFFFFDQRSGYQYPGFFKLSRVQVSVSLESIWIMIFFFRV